MAMHNLTVFEVKTVRFPLGMYIVVPTVTVGKDSVMDSKAPSLIYYTDKDKHDIRVSGLLKAGLAGELLAKSNQDGVNVGGYGLSPEEVVELMYTVAEENNLWLSNVLVSFSMLNTLSSHSYWATQSKLFTH